jgi:hypothetical protein
MLPARIVCFGTCMLHAVTPHIGQIKWRPYLTVYAQSSVARLALKGGGGREAHEFQVTVKLLEDLLDSISHRLKPIVNTT